jgi:hypothetical protein
MDVTKESSAFQPQTLQILCVCIFLFFPFCFYCLALALKYLFIHSFDRRKEIKEFKTNTIKQFD